MLKSGDPFQSRWAIIHVLSYNHRFCYSYFLTWWKLGVTEERSLSLSKTKKNWRYFNVLIFATSDSVEWNSESQRYLSSCACFVGFTDFLKPQPVSDWVSLVQKCNRCIHSYLKYSGHSLPFVMLKCLLYFVFLTFVKLQEDYVCIPIF